MGFDGTWPEWATEYMVSDEEFGIAYDAVPDDRRAWCKTTIANLHAMHGTPSIQWGRNEREWRQGFVSVQERRPADWALIFVDSTYVSAPRLLAAVMIPLLAGVPHVAVIRTGEPVPWPPALLAALELAGIESVFAMDVTKAEAFATEMISHGEGRVLLLGSVTCELSTNILCWCEPVCESLIIGTEGIDDAVVAWAHPDCEIRVCSGEQLDREAVAASAVYCATDQIDDVPDNIAIMLSSGQEGCWIWPDLTCDLFFSQRVALLSD